MRRRTVLGGLAGVLATSGCVAQLPSLQSRPIQNSEFRVEVEAVEAGAGEPPQVAFNEDESTVVVESGLVVGSSTCNKAVLTDLSYDEDTETLRVHVEDGVQGVVIGGVRLHPRACTHDLGGDTYRLTVTMTDQLPGKVVVTETPIYPEPELGGEKTTTTHENPHDTA